MDEEADIVRVATPVPPTPVADMLKIYLIAGESSGDLLGAHLMRSLRSQATRPVQFFGVGGPRMQEEGLVSLFPYYELSMLGFVEILPYVFNLTARIHKTADDIQAKDPHIVVTIDCPGFCYRVVRRLRQENYRSLFVHYVAPTVWAYKPERAEKCAAIFDHLLALLPFEPPYFKKASLPCTFVGHPAVVETQAGDGAAFRDKFGIAADTPLFCLLPGSRRSEVKRLMPIFAGTVGILAQHYPNLAIAVAVPDNILPFIAPFFDNCPFRAVVMSNDTDKKNAIAASDLAIAKSGTVTLEVAKAGTPMLVAYRVHPLSAWLLKRMVLIRYVTIINILKKNEVIPEMLQRLCTPFMLASAASVLLSSRDRQNRQKDAFKEALAMLTPKDGEQPSDKAARTILSLYAAFIQRRQTQ